MTHQPKPSSGRELTHGRGAAETAADFAKVGRGRSWESFPASLPRNVAPWPEGSAVLKQPIRDKGVDLKDGDSKERDC